MALLMTGQRPASSCSFERAPPQGDEVAISADEASGAAAEECEAVERARSVAGEAFLRNGHTALDWRRTASMVVAIVVAMVG